MYQSILVPLDGSLFAEHALPIACELARCAGATLRLVHVHTLSASPIYVEGQAVIDKNLVSLSHEHERSYLERIKASLASSMASDSKTELKIVVEAVERSLESMLNEPLGSFLATYAATTQTDLLVMTTHGRGGVARFWLGSVADALMRLSHVPMLLVRPREGAPDLAQPLRFKHILLPLDGSALAEKSLEPALALGDLLGAEYTLLRIVEPLFPAYNALAQTHELDEAATQEAWRYLEQVVQRVASDKRQLATRVVLAAQPATAILDSATQHEHDLIALATHGLGGLQRLMMGSVADKVLRGATIPILICRPPEARDTQR